MIDAMNQFMKASQEAEPMAIEFLKLQTLMIQHVWFILAVICIYALITAWLLYEIVRDFRGADRLCWLMLVTIPVLGPILYTTLGLKERDSAAMMK